VRDAERARISDRPTDSLDAYDCVLKAVWHVYRFSRESYAESRALLERAIALDPNYAQAHAYLAWCLNLWIGEGHSPAVDDDRATALAAAQRATALDPQDAFALAVHGHLLSFQEKDVTGGLDLLEQAVELNENSSLAWALSAASHAYLGHGDEARDRLRNVWRLSPFDELNFFYWVIAGIAEFVAGRYEEAVVWMRRSHRASPRFVATLRMLAATLALAGEEEEARLIAQQLIEVEPGFRISQFMANYPLQDASAGAKLQKGLQAAGLPD
jgi:tetratricopeptide (TPR) repeat protein